MRYIIFGHKGFIGSLIYTHLGSINCLIIDKIEELGSSVIQNTDVLINCAGASNVSQSFLNPIIDFQKNTILVEVLLEKIRVSGNKKIKFINLSSAAVYGNPQSLPIVEESNVDPISPYGYHKKMAEDLCRIYSRCFGLKTLSLRIFSAYGKGQRKMLLWDLYHKILNSIGVIELFGNGEESRDFIHVDDLLRQIFLAINNANFQGEAINVANGSEVKIREIAELFKKFHPIPFEYTFNGVNRPGDPLNWCADISKMKEWGYNQTVSIHDGVERYIKWAISNK